MNYPNDAKLANDAFQTSGCKTHPEFVALFGGAIGLRTFRGWLAGDRRMPALPALVLREYVAGWRPTCLK